jgi:hypothetical protein
LKPFIPRYFGQYENQISIFLKLENLLYGIKNANITDIKLGKVTHTSAKDPEKI